MRRCFCGIVLTALLLSAPVMAQEASVGVYWDREGTQTYMTLELDQFVPAYVVAFFENRLAGAAWRLDTDFLVVDLTYADGLHIGDPLGECGVDQALFEPIAGFYGEPILLAELYMWTGVTIPESDLTCIEPHCDYGSVVVADANAALYPATGGCAGIPCCVAGEPQTWGSVKTLYR